MFVVFFVSHLTEILTDLERFELAPRNAHFFTTDSMKNKRLTNDRCERERQSVSVQCAVSKHKYTRTDCFETFAAHS